MTTPAAPGAGPGHPLRDPVLNPVIASEDPGAPEPLALLEAHLALMRSITPPGSVHALDPDALRGLGIAFRGLRENGVLLGVGALKRLDPALAGEGHGEIKSMHTLAAHRGRGVARYLLEHLMDEARRAGLVRLSLETGSTDAFRAPRALYAAHGFEPCGPFAEYGPDPHSSFMTRAL